jgi:RNA polymerase sigma-70 factor (ECF subfamily)
VDVRALPDRESQPTDELGPLSGPADVVWAALYDRHFDQVYRLVRRLGVAAADVEDVTQRVFLRVHELLGQTPEILHPMAWLRAVSVRVVAEHHRFWRLRRVKAWLVEATTRAASDDVVTPEQRLGVRQDQERVADVLARMSPKLRAVLVLAELEGLGPSEVATVLGIPLNTVRSRRALARSDFERRWRACYGGRP